MRRGEIYFANLDPTVGSEIKKKRPVLIVSNDANNKASNTITIVPLTSNVKKIFPFEVFLKSIDVKLPKDSKAQCQQIRTISKLRLSGKCVARVDDKIMRQLEVALCLHLDL